VHASAVDVVAGGLAEHLVAAAAQGRRRRQGTGTLPGPSGPVPPARNRCGSPLTRHPAAVGRFLPATSCRAFGLPAHLQDHARAALVASSAPDLLGLTGFRVGGLTCRLAVDPFFLSGASCRTAVSGPLPSGRPRRTSAGWPASAREVVGAPLGWSRSREGPALAGLSAAVGLRAGALPRRTSRKSKGGDKSGKQDVEAAFEFCGAVVARQHGGETAQEGELADGQPVEA